MILTNKPINIDDLPKAISSVPQFANLYGAIYGIDRSIRKVMLDVMKGSCDPEQYMIKSQLAYQCYEILLYHVDIQAIVGKSIPLPDLIEICKKGNDCLASNAALWTTQILKRFETPKTLNYENNSVNWI